MHSGYVKYKQVDCPQNRLHLKQPDRGSNILGVHPRREPGERVVVIVSSERQLPQIVVRLESTLEKLRAPAPDASNVQNMERWWGTLLQRYDRAPIEFTLDAGVRNADIPSEVFDGVADNLL